MHLSRICVALALAACLAGPARAAVATLAVSGDAEFTFNGSAFVPSGGLTSVGTVGRDFIVNGAPEDRYALQFDLSSIPAGSTITAAQIRLRDSQGGIGHPDVLGGFAGNGSFSPASVTGGTTLLTFTPVDASSHFYDVTAFVQGLTPGQFAGFNLRQSPLVTGADLYDSSINANAPQLAVTYTAAVPLPPGAWAGVIGLAACGAFVRRACAA